jgi:hypothetical protein
MAFDAALVHWLCRLLQEMSDGCEAGTLLAYHAGQETAAIAKQGQVDAVITLMGVSWCRMHLMRRAEAWLHCEDAHRNLCSAY